jgi:glycosyltransferase involved in cell wall biosynthesis
MPAVRDWIDPVGVPVSILTRRSRGRWKDIVFAFKVGSAIWQRRHTYDVVYFLMSGLHLAVGLPIARLAGKPILMKVSGSGVITLMRKSLIGRIELKWLRQWTAAVMVLNQDMVEEAVAAGFSRDQLVWMPNPVNIDEFRPPTGDERVAWRARYSIPIHAKVIVYVGRLSPEKGLVGLLRGFTQAARILPDGLLVMLGDGPQRVELETLARELQLGASQIRFMGRVEMVDVPSWLRASDVFALTSPSEGFSCALVEAMASGLASVVSAIPANLQLIDEPIHGLTVRFDNETAIGEAFIQLFRDPERRHKMGLAARQRAIDNFSTIRVVERYEKLFDIAVGSAKKDT